MKSTNKNILLVDDEEIFQELLCEEIPRQTPITLNEISTASSGFEAIQLLKIGHSFDLIISDYNMPNGNGIEILNHLNLDKNPTKIVFFTNSINIEVPECGDNFLGIIDKFDIKSIIQIIQKSVSKNAS